MNDISMIKEVRHVGITVTNMEQSLKFYRDILGFKIQREMDESGSYIDNMLALDDVKVKTVKMSANNSDGTLIELLQFFSHPNKVENSKITRIGTSHFAITVENLDKIYLKLKNAGVKFNAPPQLSPDKYAKVTFCFDPDNTLIELVEVLDPSILKKPKGEKQYE